MKMRRFAAVFLMLAVWVQYPAHAQEAMPKGPLVIETQSGEKHSFTVELAANDDHRATGLMHRREMAADAGMLFDHGRNRRASMWMRNTYLPLDMLFIKSDGEIESIKARTVPHSETAIRSKGKVWVVLELNAGTTSRLGIGPGDTVRHRIFGNMPE